MSVPDDALASLTVDELAEVSLYGTAFAVTATAPGRSGIESAVRPEHRR
jgi:hypothetical protein